MPGVFGRFRKTYSGAVSNRLVNIEGVVGMVRQSVVLTERENRFPGVWNGPSMSCSGKARLKDNI